LPEPGAPEPPVRIRLAERADAATILAMIRALAQYERLEHEMRVTCADIERDGFGERPCFECLLAEQAGQAVGFALFFPNYSTFEGRPGLYVEDLFVTEAARGRGIGRRLLAHLAALVVARHGRRLDLWVLEWNPARRFYEQLGLRPLADWLPYRLQGEGLRQLAAEA
jgi:GNAT superfamily N-acetyltransferase